MYRLSTHLLVLRMLLLRGFGPLLPQIEFRGFLLPLLEVDRLVVVVQRAHHGLLFSLTSVYGALANYFLPRLHLYEPLLRVLSSHNLALVDLPLVFEVYVKPVLALIVVGPLVLLRGQVLLHAVGVQLQGVLKSQ